MSILARYERQLDGILERHPHWSGPGRDKGALTQIVNGGVRGGVSGSNPIAQMAGPGRWGNYGMDVSQHQDQYRHFAGYPYAVIRTIANRIAGQPLHHARKLPVGESAEKRFRPIKAYLPTSLKSAHANLHLYQDSPILDVFERPNDIMTRYVMMFNTVVSLEITGKAYWWMVWGQDEDGQRRPELWPLPAHWVQPVHTETELFAHWIVRPGGGGAEYEVPTRAMVYFYYPDPSDPLSAYSPLTALAKTVMADESIEESHRRTFLNSFAPKLGIMIGQLPESSGAGAAGTTPVLNRAQRKALKVILQEEYRGTLNTGMPLILDGFIKDVKRLDAPAAEFDYLNSAQLTQSRLAQGWGVGKASMGETENANRASSAVSDDHLNSNVVNPRLMLISEVMTRTMPRFYTGRTDEVVYLEPSHSIDIDYDLAVETSLMDRGGMSLNQARERHGLARISGGDRVLAGGEWVEIVLEDEAVPESKSRDSRPVPTSKSFFHEASLAHAWGLKQVAEHTGSLVDDHEQRMVAAVTAVLSILASEAAGRLSTLPPDQVTPTRAAQCIDRHEWERVLRGALTPLIQEAALSGAISEWMLHRRNLSAKDYQEKGILPASITSRVNAFVRSITESKIWTRLVVGSIKAVRKAVTDSLAYGSAPVPAAIEAITSEAQILTRASEIAQVQSQTAVSGGQTAAYYTLAKMGMVSRRMWKSRRDDRVRDTHQEADGQVVNGTEKFRVGGYQCDFPGDPNLPLKERCGCRCLSVLAQ